MPKCNVSNYKIQTVSNAVWVSGGIPGSAWIKMSRSVGYRVDFLCNRVKIIKVIQKP